MLHFSLLRFVYDLASMERKKSKHAMSFPVRIDMNHFLGSVQARKEAKKKPSSNSENVYELRGVLLHKGASAYHGHYEAQVFDVQCVEPFRNMSRLPLIGSDCAGIKNGISSTMKQSLKSIPWAQRLLCRLRIQSMMFVYDSLNMFLIIRLQIHKWNTKASRQSQKAPQN